MRMWALPKWRDGNCLIWARKPNGPEYVAVEVADAAEFDALVDAKDAAETRAGRAEAELLIAVNEREAMWLEMGHLITERNLLARTAAEHRRNSLSDSDLACIQSDEFVARIAATIFAAGSPTTWTKEPLQELYSRSLEAARAVSAAMQGPEAELNKRLAEISPGSCYCAISDVECDVCKNRHELIAVIEERDELRRLALALADHVLAEIHSDHITVEMANTESALREACGKEK